MITSKLSGCTGQLSGRLARLSGCMARLRACLPQLPASVDPCGENGEFHAFVFDGPGFIGGPVAFTRGEVATQGDFVYQDLVPVP